MSVNLNDTTPSAPSGKTNVKWQSSGSDVSGYVDAATSGTVTSVALTMPAEFTVAGSPVTGSGTLAVTKANETANQVYAGPTTGSPAAPAFRALVATDIPAIPESGVTGLVADLALLAPLASPTFTGNPLAPTPSPGDNDTSIATTAFVAAAVTAGTSGSVPSSRTISTTAPLTGGGDLSANRTISLGTQSANQVLAGPTTGGAVAPGFRALVAGDIPNIAESQVVNLVSDLALKAPLASPTFTGDPKAPTPSPGDNDTSIATTAFVAAAVTAGTSGIVVPATEAGASHNFLTAYNAGTGLFSKAQPVEADVVNLVSDLALKAPLASPALTGTPTAPTASPGTSTTQIATTAFVEGEIGPGGGGAYFAWGGDGSDGSVTFNGSSTILGMVPSGSVYTMTRDICCTDITVNSGVTIKTANYAIFATGTVTVNGTIHNDGQNGNQGQTATSSTGGVGGSVGLRTSNPGGNAGHYNQLITGLTGGAGGNGGTAAGTQAAATASGTAIAGTPVDGAGATSSVGSSGGKGGTGTSGAGGAVRAGGPAGTPSAGPNVQTGRHASVAVSGISWNSTTPHAVQASNPGNGQPGGGGGGGGDTTNAGGGGGGGGGEGGSAGVVAIFAHTITVGATGIIRANGGTGGNGGNGRTQTVGNVGGGGGGAGGSGGVGGIVWLVYHRLTNSGTVQAIGGTHGTGGTKGSPHGTGTDDATNGADGPDGPAGNVVYIPC